MKKISLVSDTINKNDINCLVDWLQQDSIPRLTKGELTSKLERKWADKIGTKYSVFVNSGSSSILLTLLALKHMGRIPSGKVVVPGLSWATDVSSPMVLGLDVLFCDCNLEDLSCDLTKLEKIFKSENPSTLILVSPLGLVPKMDEIITMCNKYNVTLLEDVCESMGSKYKGKYLGSFGVASFFSMYFGHHLSTIEGGFINTDDVDLYHMLLMMRSHGWDRDLPKDKQKELRLKYKCSDFDSLYNFYVPGLNLRSTDLQAFIGLRAIDKLDDYCDKRRDNFKTYCNLLNVNELNLLERDEDFVSSFAIPIVHKHRNKIVKDLQKNNIEVRPLIAGDMSTKPMIDFKVEILENCAQLNNFGFYIPNHQGLNLSDIELICNIINKYSYEKECSFLDWYQK
jgi:CDP-6-deoxy-D-xylo-4-hexulose-3-dehydrase